MSARVASDTTLYDQPAIRHAVITASNAGRALLLPVNHICIRVIRVICGQILFLLFLAEFLESGIGAQRIPDWIEPKKSWRNGR